MATAYFHKTSVALILRGIHVPKKTLAAFIENMENIKAISIGINRGMIWRPSMWPTTLDRVAADARNITILRGDHRSIHKAPRTIP